MFLMLTFQMAFVSCGADKAADAGVLLHIFAWPPSRSWQCPRRSPHPGHHQRRSAQDVTRFSLGIGVATIGLTGESQCRYADLCRLDTVNACGAMSADDIANSYVCRPHPAHQQRCCFERRTRRPCIAGGLRKAAGRCSRGRRAVRAGTAPGGAAAGGAPPTPCTGRSAC